MDALAVNEQALSDWKRLSGRERRELLRLARHRKGHPDPRVAGVGVCWAEAALSAGTPQTNRTAGRLFGFLLSLVAPAAINGGAYEDNFGVRWIARRIIEANASLK
jgi:hypothetical protein